MNDTNNHSWIFFLLYVSFVKTILQMTNKKVTCNTCLRLPHKALACRMSA